MTDPRQYDAAYQGSPGAYSEEAAWGLLGRERFLLPCATLGDVFAAVAGGNARHAVVPVENTLAGTVPTAYELILEHALMVAGETCQRIDHVLIGPPGGSRARIRRVLSHPVALAQCSGWFARHPKLVAVPVFDTAGAVTLMLNEGDEATGAIASRRAAALLGGVVLAERIQDHDENWTRFLLLAQSPAAIGGGRGAEKAMLAFSLPHEPGSLAGALAALAGVRLNLTKIESRPIRGRPFEYQFLVEVEIGDRATFDAALTDLRSQTRAFRMLGVYQRAREHNNK